jgi:uncharacterized CHY-type Zn-finger protein
MKQNYSRITAPLQTTLTWNKTNINITHLICELCNDVHAEGTVTPYNVNSRSNYTSKPQNQKCLQQKE